MLPPAQVSVQYSSMFPRQPEGLGKHCFHGMPIPGNASEDYMASSRRPGSHLLVSVPRQAKLSRLPRQADQAGYTGSLPFKFKF